MARIALAWPNLFFVLAIACHADPAPAEQVGDETGGDQPREVSYWQDVAPIYFDNCVNCHRDGGIAPFVLDDYSSAAAWAEASAIAVENRVMPPWLVTDDGSCNEWLHSRSLAQAEIETIRAWVDGGALEGQPRDDLVIPEPRRLADATPFTTPEFAPEPQGGILTEYDEYRCFLIDLQLEQDAFITGYEVVPGTPAIVHHMAGMIVDPDLEVDDGLTNLDVMTAYDDESPDRPGWPCIGAAGDGVVTKSVPIGWAPNQGVVDFPSGSGSQVDAGDMLVVQIHYNMAAGLGQSDSTTINFRFEPEVEREAISTLPDGLLFTLLDDDPHALPPGSSEELFTWSFAVEQYADALDSDRIELWGVFPHMHNAGVGMRARVLDEHGDEVGCLVDVFRWEYQWQLYYFYQQPIPLEVGQTVEVTCVYDTSRATEPILPGWGTDNEMCLLGMYLVAAG